MIAFCVMTRDNLVRCTLYSIGRDHSANLKIKPIPEMNALSADSIVIWLSMKAPKTISLQMSEICIYTLGCMITTEANASD